MKKTPEQIKREILQRVTEVARLQHKALSTERQYRDWIARYFDFCRSLPGEWPAEAKMERFLTDLAVRCDVSASTQNSAFHAVRYLYTDVIKRALDVAKVNALRARRPEQVRHAPTVEEVVALLRDVRDVSGYPSNLITRLLYGCGLRVSEPLNLPIKALQEAMGHVDINTTAGYCHDDAMSVPSPLDRLPGNVVPFQSMKHEAWSVETPQRRTA